MNKGSLLGQVGEIEIKIEPGQLALLSAAIIISGVVIILVNQLVKKAF